MAALQQPMLKKLGADPAIILNRLDAALKKLPKVSGSAETYISPRTKKVLDAASKEAQRLNDEYVSIEHLLIAIAEERGSEAAKILSSLGVIQRCNFQGAD